MDLITLLHYLTSARPGENIGKSLKYLKLMLTQLTWLPGSLSILTSTILNKARI